VGVSEDTEHSHATHDHPYIYRGKNGQGKNCYTTHHMCLCKPNPGQNLYIWISPWESLRAPNPSELESEMECADQAVSVRLEISNTHTHHASIHISIEEKTDREKIAT
jgi:hypothetical protein